MYKEFTHRGFQVRLFVGGEQSVDTLIAGWTRDFDEWEKDCLTVIGKKILSLDGTQLRVDWEAFLKSNYLRDQCNKILRDVGIFSYNPVNNWEIVGSGHLNLNQWSLGGNIFYFTREEDVVAYARLEHGQAVYGWHMQQISRVIPGG